MSKSRTRRAHPRGITQQQDQVSRALCRQFAKASNPLELERAVSWLLGEAFKRRHMVPAKLRHDHQLILGAPVMESLARVGGAGAKLGLLATSQLSNNGLGGVAGKLADAITDVIMPDWIESVGETIARRAGVVESPGDGAAIFVEIQRRRGVGPDLAEDLPGEFNRHTLAVFIDARHGGIAKRLALLRPMDEFRALPDFDSSSAFANPDPIAPAVACRRVMRAIELTDLRRDAPVDDRFADLRALSLSRVSRFPYDEVNSSAGSRRSP